MTRQRPNANIFIKLFVALHLIGIIVWSLPNPPTSVAQGIVEPTGTMKILKWNLALKQSPLRFYLLSLGTWQYWDMFAPDPASIDIWGDAEIEFKNGEKKRWQYPRIYEMPLPKKYLMERYRKFFERASDPQYAYIFPVFAQRVAFINWTDPNNPPVHVKLFRHSLVIKPPGQLQPKEYTETMYFEWDVDQKRLQEVKEEGWTAPSKILLKK